MPDVTLTIQQPPDVTLTVQQTDVNLTAPGPTNVDLSIGGATPVTLTAEQTNVNLSLNCGDTELWLNSLPPFDSNEAAILGGLVSGRWYRTTNNHKQIPGIVPTKVI